MYKMITTIKHGISETISFLVCAIDKDDLFCFNTISTFIGYLVPKPPSQKNNSNTI